MGEAGALPSLSLVSSHTGPEYGAYAPTGGSTKCHAPLNTDACHLALHGVRQAAVIDQQVCNGRGRNMKTIRDALNHIGAPVRGGWEMALIWASLALLVHNEANIQTTILLIAIAVGYGLAFVINDYYDAPFDAEDEFKAQRNFFVHNEIPQGKALLILIGISSFLFLAFAQFGIKGLVILAVCFFVMWGYSAEPLRFKSRPGFELLIHALSIETFPYLICLFLVDAAWTRLDYVMLSVAFFASLTTQLEQQVRDFEVDSKTDTNFTARFGLETTSIFLKVATSVLVFVLLVNVINGTIPLSLLPLGFIAFPSVAHRFIRGREEPRSEKLAAVLLKAGLLYIGVVFVYVLLTGQQLPNFIATLPSVVCLIYDQS